MSTGGDGVIKLWTIKSNECVFTSDAHDDKASALCVGAEPIKHIKKEDEEREETTKLVTGGADSVIIVWEDCTKAVEEEKIKEEVLYFRIRRLLYINTYVAGNQDITRATTQQQHS